MGQKIVEMDIGGFVISPVQNTAGYRLAKNVSLVSWILPGQVSDCSFEQQIELLAWTGCIEKK
jgi:hypothetical protein